MANNATEKTLADYVAIAISPMLIMALVGSLVFFLLEVFYVGQYSGRLQWILFFFVFGAVLIARISMTSDIAGRAGLYGVVLGGLVWVALLLYVEYPPGTRYAQFGWAINLFLIAIIWWSAHRLTWDCTLIDDNVDASGAGLMQMAGLEQGQESQANGQETTPHKKDAAKKKKKEPTGLSGWWQRYRKYRTEQNRRPHAPGVWVVYFSLAALPLYGLGQLLISADRTHDAAHRASREHYVFILMTIYVGSGLGLLLTTSFLGLRRYLRQRKVSMPAAVTSVWLLLGGLLTAGLLLVGAFLPRPTAGSHNVLEWAGLTAPERKASEWSKGDGEGTGKDKGTGAKGKKDGKDRAKGSGRDGQGQQKGEDARGSGKDKGQGKDGKSGKNQNGKDGRDKSGSKSDKKGGQGKNGEKDDKAGQAGDGKSDQESGSRSPLPEISPQLFTALKWIVGIVVAVVVLFLLVRSGLSWLANFTNWARRLLDALRAFWEGLWGKGASAANKSEEAEAERRAPPQPFASFHDPFLTGEAAGMSVEVLVRYSFEALEAWAAERKLARHVGETPLEFAERLGDEYPAVEADVRRLANLVAGLAYTREGIDPECREDLRQFWQTIIDAVERPMSAGAGSR